MTLDGAANSPVGDESDDDAGEGVHPVAMAPIRQTAAAAKVLCLRRRTFGLMIPVMRWCASAVHRALGLRTGRERHDDEEDAEDDDVDADDPQQSGDRRSG